MGGRSGFSDRQLVATLEVECVAPQALDQPADPLSLVSSPESKQVRILVPVLFQICQYACIGQIDPLRVLPVPARYLTRRFKTSWI